MAEVTMQTIIVKNTDSGRETQDGQDYSETMRVPGVLWRKLGGNRGIEEGERALAQWLGQSALAEPLFFTGWTEHVAAASMPPWC